MEEKNLQGRKTKGMLALGAALLLMGLPASALAAEQPAAASPADPANPASPVNLVNPRVKTLAGEQVEGAQSAKAAHYPAFALHGNVRAFYADARVRLPGVRTRINAYTANRRLQLYPSVQLSPEWKLTGMLEDNRYDRQYGANDHRDDNHLYLDRLYVTHETSHGTRLIVGRDNIWPIEGNVMDLIVEGVRYGFGDASCEGRVDLFAGRTVGYASRVNAERKNGVVLSYDRKTGPWEGALLYYGFHRDDNPVGMPSLTDFGTVKTWQKTLDEQHVGELYLGYHFDRHVSLELEGLYGHGSAKRVCAFPGFAFPSWNDTRTGYVATLRLRQQPLDLRKVGDYGLWVSYYQMPRVTYLYPTIDPDVTVFGRDGFRGIGTRLDVVAAPGLLLQVMYYDLKNRDENVSVLGLQPFAHASERLLGVSLRQFW